MKAQSVRSLLHEITYDAKSRIDTFTSLDQDQQLLVLLQLSKHVQSQVLAELSNSVLVPLLEKLDPDDATDLLQNTPKRKQKELLVELSEELQDKISLLLQFDPKTAAGLMSLNYIQANHDDEIYRVAEQIHTHEKRTGRLPEILVLETGKLVGFLPIHKLLLAKPSEKVKEYIQRITSLRYTESREKVVDHFLDHPHQKVVVLDESDAILGILYSDDVLRALQQTEGSSLYDFAGVSNEETVFGSVKQKVKYRYKWLIINLATAFLASFTVSLFDETISKYVLLAVYMPIVAGMGGNAATQTLAVLVRGIALRQIDLQSCLPTLRREILAALINGLINGVLVAAIVIIFNRDVKVAVVLAVAMTINLLVAGFFGTLVPVIMKKLGKDPATSATIFITTATDVLGFLAFLGLASLVLN
mgnify:CR=1 FL=1